MRTFGKMHADCNKAGHPNCYYGERQDWLVVAGRSRDSDILEESNFAAILAELDGEGDTVAIERESHWACGWVEHLLIHPADALRIKLADDLCAKMEDYPILNETDYSNREDESCRQIWEGCFDAHERITYFRKHGHQRIGAFRQLLAAVRGDWYSAAQVLNCPSDLAHS